MQYVSLCLCRPAYNSNFMISHHLSLSGGIPMITPPTPEPCQEMQPPTPVMTTTLQFPATQAV